MNRTLLIPMLLVFLVASCQKQTDGLDGTLWMQTAAEYEVSARQVYRAATSQLERALRDNTWTAALEQKGGFTQLPPAVILDVDETVLDNSAFQARLLVDGTRYNGPQWDTWVRKVEAKAVPGALDFVKKARELGIVVVYLTNRECDKAGTPCPQQTATVENLTKLGFPDVTSELVLLKYEQKDWVSEKQSRRLFLAKQYRILMLLGDDLGDFVPNAKGEGVTSESRRMLAAEHSSRWGERWFLLPNPLYGSWLRVIKDKRQALEPYRD